MDKFLNKVGIDKYVRFNIIVFSIMAFVTLSFGSLLMHLFGSSYFALNYKDNFILNEIVSYTFMYLNCVILSGIVFRIYNKSIFGVGFLYFLFQIVVYKLFIDMFPYVNFPTPFILVLIHCILRKDIKLKYFKNLIILSVTIIFFQVIELKYRMIFYSFIDYNLTTSYIEKFVIYLNIFILQVLIYYFYYIKEVMFNARIYTIRRNSGKFLFNAKSKSGNEPTQEEIEILDFYKSMTIGQRIYVTFIFCSIQILQMLLVVLLCFIGSGTSGVINLIIILIAFWINRKIIGTNNSFHFDNFKLCTIFSMLIFFIATLLSPQPYFSTFISVSIGVLIAVFLCILKFYSNRYKELEDKVGDLIDKENKE